MSVFEEIRRAFEAAAVDEGLRVLGCVSLDASEDYPRFVEWLSQGRHADMQFLERNAEFRKEPERLLPGAQSAILLGMPYDLGDGYLDVGLPRIAQYARLPDYHRTLKKKGLKIVERIESLCREFETRPQFRVAVDSAPLLERGLFARAKEGFIGKNTCYIHPKFGSFFLLAEILTTLALPLDVKSPISLIQKTRDGGCGPCNRCQVSCPTEALAEDYSIDANLCLAYWTIENRGVIPEKFWPHLAKYYFGCDLCQLACPYNIKAERLPLPKEMREREFPSLFEVAVMNQKNYESYFGGTPLVRAKRSGLRRNALIAMAVTGDPNLLPAMEAATADAESPIAETLEQIRSWLKGQSVSYG